MKCHKHEDRDAVGTCMDCHVGLCSECSKYFEILICPNCNLKRLTSDKSTIRGEFMKYSLGGVFSAAFVALFVAPSYAVMLFGRDGMSSFATVLTIAIGAYFGFLMPYGWAFINGAKDPNSITVRVNEGIIALIFRKTIKFAVAVVIGGFVGPYQILKMKKRLAEVNGTIAAIQSAA